MTQNEDGGIPDDIPDGTCVTCSANHRILFSNGVIPKHPFNDGSIGTSEIFGRRLASGDRTAPLRGLSSQIQVSDMRWPFDPVLRQALINKGVITPDELKQAEDQIRSVTGQFMGGGTVS